MYDGPGLADRDSGRYPSSTLRCSLPNGVRAVPAARVPSIGGRPVVNPPARIKPAQPVRTVPAHRAFPASNPHILDTFRSARERKLSKISTELRAAGRIRRAGGIRLEG